jgi:hypothetical protein
MARVVWSVREGRSGESDAPALVHGYRSSHPVCEPKLGEVDSPENVLIVERVH